MNRLETNQMIRHYETMIDMALDNGDDDLAERLEEKLEALYNKRQYSINDFIEQPTIDDFLETL